MFQDLVEQDILYTAVFAGKEGTTFNPNLLKTFGTTENNKGFKNITETFEGGSELKDIVRVYDVSDMDVEMFNDLSKEHFMVIIYRDCK